ncbi:phospholipase A1-like [Spodoptera litura]|uniref:Phospholipase A1-like n=1 Tax=Spodoptera litura TaxID=69820 RepID=A0A9J7DUM7_SPOLT|nr:phospholipase A1-like [Spodoptera litura]XP_022818763.1 phospholipase A1-like [Spodoptera litura]XP_022818765.1 phospholipase A1-like [Spodoptera litura]
MSQMFRLVVVAACLLIGQARAATYGPRADYGYPAGLIPDCPGTHKNASISARHMNNLQIAIHRISSSGQVVRRTLPLENAPKVIARDKNIDLKNKKTVVYAVGFMDSSAFPFSQAIGTSYAKRGYNVFVSETLAFLTYIYPKSVRLVRFIGKKMGEFLVRLTELGVDPANLELVGTSLGAHELGYAAKHFFKTTGKKVSRLTGLDPAGPCFRSLGPEDKLWKTDAELVDVIHTNIDGFGIAEALGHIDIYANGGEFQPSDIPYIPCLVICSHVRSMIYWWQALEHPKKFIAVKCNSIQEARFAQCFNNTETNYLGVEAQFDKPGIYYLATNNEFPYYMGKEGLKEENEIYTSVVRRINDDDGFVA